MMLPFAVVLSAIVYVRHASCQVTTLFIPGFDPQPVTANLLGTQGGLTSYVIAPGMSTVGLDDEDGFFGPATLVLGASTAAVTYIDESVGAALYENCQLVDGQAVCEDVIIQMGSDGFTSTATETQPIESFAVQGGGAASGSDAIQTSPVPTGNFATWTQPPSWTSAYSTLGGSVPWSPPGSASSSASRTSGSSSSTASPTGNTSGAVDLRASGLSMVFIVGMASVFTLVV